MSKTYCSNCDRVLEEDDVRWANEEVYCEECFSDRFTYCVRCDSVIRHSDANYSNDESYCDECWNENYDEDSPDNPDVDESDRAQIIELSRSWLLGKSTKRCVIKINPKDLYLKKLKERVGLVDSPLYVFGLKDRDEYQISTSPNLIDAVREYILLNGLVWEVTEGIGCSRLGLSYTLRLNYSSQVTKLIRSITRVKEPVIA